MKVTGFSFVRNAIKYDYPIVEALKSILPICDEVVVAVGDSDDTTRELVASIAPEKIRIIDTVWDDSLREGGKVLAVETDKALDAISQDSDWCFYIQGDEVMHESYLSVVKEAMLKHKDNKSVDGLLFDYQHFYGSYDYVGISSRWYRREIRVVRKRDDIFSYRDAQGFRKGNNQKLNVKKIKAEMYHYGWVKDPRKQQAKHESFNRLWHDDNWVEENVVKAGDFDYSNVDALKRFEGSHPEVMQDRIDKLNWEFDYDISSNKLKSKDKFKFAIEKWTGIRPGEYKNYKEI